MVSLLYISFIGILTFVVVIVQTKPLVETSNNINETKSPIKSQQQLYELYKIMRADPRFASVTNQDMVSYIYRNFVLGNDNAIDFVKPKNPNQRRYRHRKINQAEQT